MLVLNPRVVKFGAEVWRDVTAVIVDRSASREAVEWSDGGPHAVLADVPEQRVEIRIVQEVSRDDVDAPRPGEQGQMVFYTSPMSTDAARRKVSATAVVLEAGHELSLRRGALRTVRLIAVSADGSADPITVEDAAGGQV